MAGHDCRRAGIFVICCYFLQLAFSMPPSQPDNLTCISYNFLNLVCSFSLDDNGSDLPVNWTMEYAVFHSSTNERWKALPRSRCDLATFTCSWGSVMDSGTPWTFNTATSHYYVRIKVETQNTSYWSREWVVNMTAIVKPDPVHSLRAVMHEATLLLEWRLPNLHVADVAPIEFLISLLERHGWDNRTINVPPVSYNEFPPDGEFHYNVSELLAYAVYTVTVQTRPAKAKSDIYWSEPAEITVQTPARTPAVAPTMTEGAFVVEEGEELLNVTFCWKNPHDKYLAGTISGFYISAEHSRNITISSRTSGFATCLKIDNVNNLDDYLVNVQMINNVGVSPKSAVTWRSWKIGSKVRGKFVAVQGASASVLLSWSPPRDLCKVIANVTYYWCKVNRENANIPLPHCETFDWMTVNVDGICEDTVYQWLNNTGDPRDMRYAVSIATDVGSGGMVWDKYRYSNYNVVPAKPRYQVSRAPNDKSSVTVKMVNHEYPQFSQGGQPNTFQLIHGEVTAHDASCPMEKSPVTYQAHYSKPEITIKNLKSGTQYVVCVRGVNHAGAGLYGQPFVVQLHKDSIKHMWAVILGACFVGAVCFVTLGCLIRKGCKRVATLVKSKTYIATNKPLNSSDLICQAEKGEKNMMADIRSKLTFSSHSKVKCQRLPLKPVLENMCQCSRKTFFRKSYEDLSNSCPKEHADLVSATLINAVEHTDNVVKTNDENRTRPEAISQRVLDDHISSQSNENQVHCVLLNAISTCKENVTQVTAISKDTGIYNENTRGINSLQKDLIATAYPKPVTKATGQLADKTIITTLIDGYSRIICETGPRSKIKTRVSKSTPTSDHCTVSTDFETDSKISLMESCSDDSLLSRSDVSSDEPNKESTRCLECLQDFNRRQSFIGADFCMVACDNVSQHMRTTNNFSLKLAKPAFEAESDTLWIYDGNASGQQEVPCLVGKKSLPCIPRPRNFHSCSSAGDDLLEQHAEESTLFANEIQFCVTSRYVEMVQDEVY